MTTGVKLVGSLIRYSGISEACKQENAILERAI
jgi:hypothetical protein